MVAMRKIVTKLVNVTNGNGLEKVPLTKLFTG